MTPLTGPKSDPDFSWPQHKVRFKDATSVPRPLLSMSSIQRRFRTIRWVSFSKPRTTRLSSSASSPKTIRPRHRTTATSSVLETSSPRAMAPLRSVVSRMISPRRHRSQYKSKLVGPLLVAQSRLLLLERKRAKEKRKIATSPTPQRPPRQRLRSDGFSERDVSHLLSALSIHPGVTSEKH